MRYVKGLSKTAERSQSSGALFRHTSPKASSSLSGAREPTRARAAIPHDLQSACALLSDSHDLYASLLNPEGTEGGAGDPASHEASAKRRLEALRCLIGRPAATVTMVWAKVMIVHRCVGLVDGETEVGQFAIELVHDLALIRCNRHDPDQVHLPPDSTTTIGRGCLNFYIAARLYEAAVFDDQIDQSEIDIAWQSRADALAALMSLPATTIAAAVAKARVVMRLSHDAGHDATDLGLLAIEVLAELVSILGGA